MLPNCKENKAPEKRIKMEISNLLDAEFRTLAMKMLGDLNENSKGQETMGQSQVNRLDEAEDLVSDLEDKGAENTQLEQQRKRESKS